MGTSTNLSGSHFGHLHVVSVIMMWSLLAAVAEPAADVFHLDELVVYSESDVAWESRGLAVMSPHAWLDLPGVSVVPQGAGAQADLQIRGSSFSGAGLSLSGLALRHPQTEHFHSELPLAPALFGTPAVRTGVGQAVEGSGHLVGALSLSFLPASRRGELTAAVGQTDRDRQTVFAQEALPIPHLGDFGVSAFIQRENADGADCRDNYLDLLSGGGHLQLVTPTAQTDAAFGYSTRHWGARSHYGVTPTWPAEETFRDAMAVVTSRIELDDEGAFVRFTGVWRDSTDVYTLDRYRDYLYRNHHTSEVWAGGLDGLVSITDAWAVRWNVEYEHQDLDSFHTGVYPGGGLGEEQRDRLGLALLPVWTHGPWHLQAGGRAVFFNGDTPAWLPVAGLAYDLCAGHRLFLEYSETVRQPSYTELNYESPVNLGNADLDRQRAQSLELRWEGRPHEAVEARLAIFRRWEREAIDWTRDAPGGSWRAVNLDGLVVDGAELLVHLRPHETVAVSLAYQFLDKESDSHPYASRYVLDYARHEGRLGVVLRPLSRCELRTTQVVREFADNVERGSSDLGVLGSCEVDVLLIERLGFHLVAGVENMWNSSLELLPGQRAAGRRWTLAGRLAW